ncbi:hypothetical protein HYQ45_006913 [Verticillium longisporum]|uniref:Uncharacterized protein n=2 Tax=Verticillium longisporum TaxID=100787 RepID=A0A8I2ZN07_VERLO|nr:hypothetical protein HYQ45_006913 [Verticillium longisporum]
MIAGYMTRYCAAITTQELEHVYPKVIDHELDLRRPIYASYLKIDGNIYGDGLKVRQVEGSSEQVLRDPLAQLLWQAPLAYSPGLISIVTLGTPIPWPSRRRMKFFECNHPDAAGYLVTCTGFEVYDIAVHKRDEKPHVNLCEDMPYRHLHWMYMPLDVGEHITHISRQLDHDGEFRMVRTGLTFTTNKGRNTVFGAYATQADEVFKMPRNMTKVYFNWWDNPGVHAGLEYVALEPTAQPKEAVLYEAPELPIALGVHCRKPLSMDADSMLFG